MSVILHPDKGHFRCLLHGVVLEAKTSTMNKLLLPTVVLYLLSYLLLAPCLAQEKGMNIIAGRPPFATLEERQQTSLGRKADITSMKAPVAGISFRYAAAKAIPGVVHILATYKPGFRGQLLYPYSRFYPDDMWPNSLSDANIAEKGSASGVLVTNDGYIVTNCHVVKDTREIEVILHDQYSYKARLIGMDSLTDLALIKIDGRDLPFVTFGASDSIAIGDWVLAVGNPLNLASTVTAGIVSAKSRTINTLEERGGLYSFIQTDAVMNDGNSGGALVDINGRLVGINTGIVTPTGEFTGYAFSIPVEIVKKVSNDLLQYGAAQRAYMGVFLRNVEDRHGVRVDSLVKNGPAMLAGIRQGDMITAVSGHEVEVVANFNEAMLLHRPGDKIIITVNRKNRELYLQVALDGCQETAQKINRDGDELLNVLGIEVMEMENSERELLKIKGGVKVIKVRSGKIYRSTSIEPGFIIMEINGQPVSSRAGLADALKRVKGRVLVSGIYDDYPQALYYAAFYLE